MLYKNEEANERYPLDFNILHANCIKKSLVNIRLNYIISEYIITPQNIYVVCEEQFQRLSPYNIKTTLQRTLSEMERDVGARKKTSGYKGNTSCSSARRVCMPHRQEEQDVPSIVNTTSCFVHASKCKNT